jgi:hypothetical protein
MNSFIPIGTLKRDEIYSFIGGLFIASSWYLYFAGLSGDTTVSEVAFVTKPIFLVSWLLSTALLFAMQLSAAFVVIRAIKYWLKSKNEMERKKILGLQDPIEDFIFVEFVNDLKYSAHLVGIIIFSTLLSLFPLYKVSSSFTTHNASRRFTLFLTILALVWLSFILANFGRC